MRMIKKMMGLLLIFFPISFTLAATVTEPVIYTEDKPAAIVTADHPEFSVKLKSNPTTGYLWYLRSYDANILQPVKHIFEPPENKKLMGAPGYQIWTFRVKPEGFLVPMQTFIRFVYARPWDTNVQGRHFVFQVTTQEKAK